MHSRQVDTPIQLYILKEENTLIPFHIPLCMEVEIVYTANIDSVPQLLTVAENGEIALLVSNYAQVLHKVIDMQTQDKSVESERFLIPQKINK